MTPLALAMYDAPNRPDDADARANAGPDPEVEPGAPDRRDVPEPEIPPPNRPEITPPDQPEITPPGQPGIPSPDPPEITPPDHPEITPPPAPEITPPDQPDIAPPDRPDVSEPPQRELASAYGVEAPGAVSSRLAEAPEPPGRPPVQRAVLALLLIAAAAMIGYVLSSTDERSAEPDALGRSVEAAGNLRLLLRTDVPADARQFVREEFGWRVGVPVFEAVGLSGVAIAQAAPAVEVPVFLYADAEDRNVAVFAYSYALLDQVPDRLRLTADDYERLDEGTPVVRRTAGGDVLLWRDRDDIYVAVTDLPPDALIGGLSMAR